MLYKVGLSYKLLLVILGMSPNNFNGNADNNNNVNNTNGARPDSC